MHDAGGERYKDCIIESSGFQAVWAEGMQLNVYEALLCSRLTTDTGTILELWELSNGEFEILCVEAHRPDEVVYAVTLSLVEVELLAEKIAQATEAVRNEPPEVSP